MNPAANSRLRPTKLGLETIVHAAIIRTEREGMEELSARKLARDLGCEAMSLYHYVGSMESLKDAMVERLLGSIAPAQADEPVEALRQEAQAYLALAQAHPRSFLLVATRRWKGEKSAQAAARVIKRFNNIGFSQDHALSRARALGAYLNGAGLALAAWATEPDAPQDRAAQVNRDLQWGLDLFIRSLAKPTC